MIISKLPRRVKKLAKKNRKTHANRYSHSPSFMHRILNESCLWYSFVWVKTKEGHDFWLKWAEYEN